MKTKLAWVPALLFLALVAVGVWRFSPSHNQGKPVGISVSAACLVPNWYIDPQNVSGCASDGNSCQSRTCVSGGVGPCSTWGQVLSRLGPSPVFSSNVAVTFMSAQTSRTDPVNLAATFIPSTSTPILLTFQADLPTPCTGTLASLRAKNTTLSTTSAPLLASVSCFTSANLLVVNTTRGSQAFTALQSSGTQYDLTQPVNSTTFVEDDTWANGDSVSVYTLSNVYFTNEQINWAGSSSSGVLIKNISVWSPDGVGVDFLTTTGSAFLEIQGSTVQSAIQDGTYYGVFAFNDTIQAGFQSSGQSTSLSASAQLHGNSGGIIWTGCNWFVGIDSELFAGGGLETFRCNGVLSNTYVDNTSMLFDGNVGLQTTSSVYGPGTIFAQAPGHFEYNTTSAVGSLNIAGLRLSNGTAPTLGAGCSSNNLDGGAALATNCGIAITAAALDACPASATAFCGFAWSPMGAFIGKGNF